MPQQQTQQNLPESLSAPPAAIPAALDERQVRQRLEDIRRRYQRHLAAWASDVLVLRRAGTVVGVGTSAGGADEFWLKPAAPSDHGMAA